jgi:hypothetical protein
MSLNTNNNFTDADAFYAELTELHRELDSSQSERVNARLILLLANHIGDNATLSEAMKIAAQISEEA